LGSKQSARYVLPIVAVEVAKAARRGEVDEEDATDLYLAYWEGTAAPGKIVPTADSPKSQISKLRMIIKAADPDLLDRVAILHEKCKREGEAVLSLYASMVETSRVQASRHAKLRDREILEIIRK
jgi:hypothetical protein